MKCLRRVLPLAVIVAAAVVVSGEPYFTTNGPYHGRPPAFALVLFAAAWIAVMDLVGLFDGGEQ
ncbi:hypothetical protein OV203_32280 [Nannocystis sp. ILAH1]|uniref:hypothetical protein n=1 Tax=Nannocystis sp. ILAH1 TaxID=2996789 RepID=UPI00226E82F3|nr:hypothetical protein [Nannocystis sp. ILAH1]MCY0991861.1 hypothetical protein [Nannocystis sp. ILAH1]